jgi:hypothetical protein
LALSEGATTEYFLPKRKKLKGINISLATRSKDTNWSFFLFQINFNSHAFVGSDFLAYFSFVGEKKSTTPKCWNFRCENFH